MSTLRITLIFTIAVVAVFSQDAVVPEQEVSLIPEETTLVSMQRHKGDSVFKTVTKRFSALAKREEKDAKTPRPDPKTIAQELCREESDSSKACRAFTRDQSSPKKLMDVLHRLDAPETDATKAKKKKSCRAFQARTSKTSAVTDKFAPMMACYCQKGGNRETSCMIAHESSMDKGLDNLGQVIDASIAKEFGKGETRQSLLAHPTVLELLRHWSKETGGKHRDGTSKTVLSTTLSQIQSKLDSKLKAQATSEFINKIQAQAARAQARARFGPRRRSSS